MRPLNQKVPKPLQREIFERDQYVCQGCRKKLPCVLDIPASARHYRGDLFLVVDHIDGPAIDPGNLQALCWSCNSHKAGRGNNSFKLSVALKQLGPCMTYYPSMASIVGLKESIFLCQLIYWTPRSRHERGDGWIYKSVEEMVYETGLSYKEQMRIRRALVLGGFLQEEYERTEHRLYFRVVPDKVDEIGFQLGKHVTNGQMPESRQPSAQKSAGTLPEVSSIKGSKDYSEITQKNQDPPYPPFSKGGLSDRDRRRISKWVDQLFEDDRRASTQGARSPKRTWSEVLELACADLMLPLDRARRSLCEDDVWRCRLGVESAVGASA